MANEIKVTSVLYVKLDGLEYGPTRPGQFTMDMTTARGPTPGSLDVTTAGVDVDLSALTTPGICRITNYDDTNYVTYGIWDGVEFHPLGEVGPGESYVLKLSRLIGDGVGTGYENLRLVANSATCVCSVEAFER